MIAFTTKELARLFGVDRSTVQGWREKGLIHPVGQRGTALLYDYFETAEAERVTRNSPNLRVPRSRVIVGT